MNRRNMIKTAIGGVGTLLASTTLAADACKSFMTPAQPEGPFYPVKKIFDQDANLVRVEGRSQEAEGTKILIVGKVIDQHCRPVEGALIDLWQACHTGRYNHPSDTNAAELDLNFQYSAEILTAANGEFRLRTIIPGAYPASDTWIRPPHIHLRIEKRGFHELTTQLYFDRFRELNQKDLILKDLPSEQQSRLVMSQRFAEEGDDDLGLVSFRYDVELSVRQVSNS